MGSPEHRSSVQTEPSVWGYSKAHSCRRPWEILVGLSVLRPGLGGWVPWGPTEGSGPFGTLSEDTGRRLPGFPWAPGSRAAVLYLRLVLGLTPHNARSFYPAPNLGDYHHDRRVGCLGAIPFSRVWTFRATS